MPTLPSSPPSITANLQPNRFTKTLQSGPGGRGAQGGRLGGKQRLWTFGSAAAARRFGLETPRGVAAAQCGGGTGNGIRRSCGRAGGRLLSRGLGAGQDL